MAEQRQTKINHKVYFNTLTKLTFKVGFLIVIETVCIKRESNKKIIIKLLKF